MSKKKKLIKDFKKDKTINKPGPTKKHKGGKNH